MSNIYLDDSLELSPPNRVVGVINKKHYLSEAVGRPPVMVTVFDVFDYKFLRNAVAHDQDIKIEDLIIWRLEVFDSRFEKDDSRRFGYYFELDIDSGGPDSAIYPAFQDNIELNNHVAKIRHVDSFDIVNPVSQASHFLAYALREEWKEVNKYQVRPFSNQPSSQNSSPIESNLLNTIDKPVSYIAAEPIAQGNFVRVIDDSGQCLVAFDAGFGTPLRKSNFSNWSSHAEVDIEEPKVLFITHWDNDHFRLLEIQSLIDLNNIYCVFPFDFLGGASYENRPTVLRIVSTLLKNQKAVPLTHSSSGVFVTSHYDIEYEVGDKNQNRNNAGASYRLNLNNSFHLLPGDKCYSKLPTLWTTQKYHSVIASHHGADSHRFDLIPLPATDDAELVFSFGTHGHYKHPRLRVLGHNDGYIRYFSMDEDWVSKVGSATNFKKYIHWENTAKKNIVNL